MKTSKIIKNPAPNNSSIPFDDKNTASSPVFQALKNRSIVHKQLLILWVNSRGMIKSQYILLIIPSLDALIEVYRIVATGSYQIIL